MRMEWFDKHTASVLITILIFIGVGAFIYGARRILIVFLLAILFAYLLEPLVHRLERWNKVSRGSREIAIAEVYVIISAALAILFILIGPHIADEARKLGEALPGFFQKISSGQIVSEIGSKHGWSRSTQIHLRNFFAAHKTAILNWVASLGARAAGFASNLLWVVLIPILAIFFLRDGRAFAERLVEAVDRRQQKRFLVGITVDLNEMLAHYIRMQLILAGLSLAAYMSVLSLLRVPYSLALGAIAGVLEFIPIVGPLVGAILILGVGFLANYHYLLVVAIFLGGWRLLQDYFTSPRLMGGKLELHPLVVIFAVLAGAEIGGIIGVYLSIPVAAALHIFWRRWQRVYSTDTKIKAA